MAYAVYTSRRTRTLGCRLYVGTREENLSACLEIVAEQVAEVAAGNLRPREFERAKENLKGRITLSMESTSNRMSRLGKSLITDTELLSFDRIIAEIDAVEPENVSSSRPSCSRPSGCRRRDRPRRGALPPRARAAPPGTPRARSGVRVAPSARRGAWAACSHRR